MAFLNCPFCDRPPEYVEDTHIEITSSGRARIRPATLKHGCRIKGKIWHEDFFNNLRFVAKDIDVLEEVWNTRCTNT